jgi:hypothetical protein
MARATSVFPPGPPASTRNLRGPHLHLMRQVPRPVLARSRPDEGIRVALQARPSPYRAFARRPARRSPLAARIARPAHPVLVHLMTVDAVPHRHSSSRHRVKGVRVVRTHPLGQGHPSSPIVMGEEATPRRPDLQRARPPNRQSRPLLSCGVGHWCVLTRAADCLARLRIEVRMEVLADQIS